MPFTGSTFTLPIGSINATPGAIVQSATWNAIHVDLNTGLTQTMAQLIATPTTRNILVVNGSLDAWFTPVVTYHLSAVYAVVLAATAIDAVAPEPRCQISKLPFTTSMFLVVGVEIS